MTVGIDFTEAIQAREKEALKEIAPTIIEIVKALGIIAPDGSYILNQKGGAKFSYNPLYQTVTVEHGANDMFRANIVFKTVTVYKRGSWEHAYRELKAQYESVDKETVAQRNLCNMLDNLGLPRP